MENLPGNFQQILQHEREVVAQWKKEGILEQLYLRPTKNGEVILFRNTSEEVVRQLIESSPLYQFIQSIEYYPLLQQFLVITGLY